MNICSSFWRRRTLTLNPKLSAMLFLKKEFYSSHWGPRTIFFKAVLLLYFEHQQKCHGNLIFLFAFYKMDNSLEFASCLQKSKTIYSNPLGRTSFLRAAQVIICYVRLILNCYMWRGEGSLNWFIQFSFSQQVLLGASVYQVLSVQNWCSKPSWFLLSRNWQCRVKSLEIHQPQCACL